MKLKIEYVVSVAGSASFEGPGVERGVLDAQVAKTFTEISDFRQQSAAFNSFATDSNMRISVHSGQLKLNPGRGPLYVQEIKKETDFESIRDAGQFNGQQWPVLTEGTSFIIRGFQSPNDKYSVSKYCVKCRVVELSEAK